MLRSFRPVLLFALLLVPWGCGDFESDRLMAPDGADADRMSAPGIKVMTQNLYLGVDLGTLLSATTPGEIQEGFQQLVLTTAFDATQPQLGPRRLFDIARQIAMEAPHVVGLQEVSRYEFAFADGSTAVLDFQEVMEPLLNAMHPVYDWVWVENPLVAAPTLNLPVLGGVAVNYYDTDALLVRSDLWPRVTGQVLEVFAAAQDFNVFGTIFPYHRGYEAVTLDIGGQDVMFVNTHLEVQLFEDVQLAQTAELIEFMASHDGPVIALGDFNSAANPLAPEGQKSGSYQMLRSAGYADLWLREAHSVGGATCCQAGDLTNPESELTARLDLVLVRWGPAGFGGQSDVEVLGEEAGDRISFYAVSPFAGELGPLTLWPSDHAGVVATLRPAPGRVGPRPGH